MKPIVALMVVAVAVACSSDPARSEKPESNATALNRAVARAGPARAPFEGLTAGEFSVGVDRADLVIADSEPERVEGLRGRASLAPYDGMLFAFAADTDATFTMSGTVAPLEIAFYAADGELVGRRSMTPCAGTDATCPAYSPGVSYRWAVETPGGHPLPGGVLRAA